jgi:hypothetical protein
MFLVLIFVCGFAGLTAAQTATATLTGVVVDESDAVVPDAELTLANSDTSVERQVVANSEGRFTFPFVPPGRYTVTAQRNGFAPGQITNVVLNVGDNLGIRLALTVGGVSDSVTVVGETATVKQSGQVSTSINRQFVENLPMNGRTFQSLIALTPGAVTVQSEVVRQGQFSVNGQRATSNYWTIDGVSANAGATTSIVSGRQAAGVAPATGATGGTNNLVSVDALEEFTIQTSTFAPEFGRTPGAQVSLVTRSGTNTLHGTLFDYFRNDALDANDWFANRNGLSKPPLRQHQFGGVFGGPITKGRTFFFFSYEGLRLRQPQVRQLVVPSLSMRQEAAPMLQPILNGYSLPNGTVFSDGLAQFNASFSDTTTLDATSLRVDHTRGGALTVFGRYNYSPSFSTARTGSNNASISFETHTATAGATQTFSSRLQNELRANYTFHSVGRTEEIDSFGGAVPFATSTLFPSYMPQDDGTVFVRVGSSAGLSPGKWPGSTQRSINVVDNVSLVTAAHHFKFGVDYRHLLPSSDPHGHRLDVTFGSLAAVRSGVPNPMLALRYLPVALTFRNFSTYAQDTWRASGRLTMTYGFRWEVNPAPVGRDGTQVLTLTGIDDLSTATLAPAGTALYQTTYNNFAPRVGAAYRLSQSGNTLLRGGFGVFYDLGAAAGPSSSNFPFNSRVTLPAITPFPIPAGQVGPPPPVSLEPPYGTLLTVTYPDLKLGYVLQHNAAIEHSFGSNTVSATYVGAIGRRLLQFSRTFAPQPRFVSGAVVEIASNGGTSDYHALQTQFQRRLSRGLQALASYTLAHSIDTDSGDSNTPLPPLTRVDAQIDRGPSTFDIRQSLTGAVTYEIPGPARDGLMALVLRDFAMDAIVRVQSAPPITVFSQRDIGFGLYNFRPDIVPGVPIWIEDSAAPGGRRLNRAAFDAVTPQNERRIGTHGRNSLRGFGLSQLDLAFRRQFQLQGATSLQFRAELFNVFNTPNFASPDTNLTSNLFGQSNTMLGRGLTAGTGGSGTLSPLYQIGGPRSMQLALKLQF